MRRATFDKVTGRKADKHSGHAHELTDLQVKGLFAHHADTVAVVMPEQGG